MASSTSPTSSTRVDRGQAYPTTATPPKLPAFLMGVGLGGFVDGIILHEILQWHHMLSDERDFPTDTLQGLEGNVVADGFFHVGTWVFVFVGMLVTLNAWQRRKLAPPWRSHFGMLLVGWGLFNLVEGVIDHQILGIHHVRDDLGGPLSWDIGFLVFGALLVLVGLALSRSGESVVARRQASSTTAPPDRVARRTG
ncbi:MAG: DUF2243 domain-containing protein [Acidimicrobiales bacterium]|nr:DUF2243 domain-containing protein [Acidimicrobiales bacterium]